MRMKSWLVVSLVVISFLSWMLPAYAILDAPQNLSFEERVLEVIRTHPKVVLDSVKTYQEQQAQEQDKRQSNLVKELIAHPNALVSNSPVQGSLGKILIVEFSDFQCPYCAQEYQVLKKFVDTHQDEVTFVYKHLPLTHIHNEAMSAAKAAWAAQQQGKFWPYHDELFKNGKNLEENLYVSLAKNLDLDLERFNRDRTGDDASTAIQEDIDLAQMLGIKGTPFFLMNEETFSGAVPLAEIESKFLSLKELDK